MAKRKSRSPSPSPPPPPEFMRALKVGTPDTEIGIPEVDRLMYGRKFRYLQPNSVPFTRITATNKVPKIMKGHKFPKLSPHPRPKVNNKRTEDEDRISRLPDDILQFIISSLSLREGVATSVLSTRWRYLWTASFSSLNFDVPNMLGPRYTPRLFQTKNQQFLSDKMSRFATRVNHVFERRRASRLDALRLAFGFRKDSTSQVDRWIQSAAAQGVTDIELDFDLLTYCNTHGFEDRYEFPAQQFASSLKYLRLDSCIFHLPPDFTGFTSLVTLLVSDIFIDQSVVDFILSKCPLLEFLSLGYCRHVFGSSLKFIAPSPLLKHLHIGGVGPLEIELHDVSLLSFELNAYQGKLSIKNAPHLVRLAITTSEPVEILSNLPRLETLFLTEHDKKSIIPSSFMLNNLKRLVFIANKCRTNLLRVLSLLEACHSLQELEIDMGVSESSRIKPLSDTMMRRLTTMSRSSHNNLKEIDIYGFQALTKRIELVHFLLKYAIVLEKMKIYTTSKMYHGNGEWSLHEPTAKQAISLEEVCKALQRVARSSTRLELFTSLSQSATTT